METRAAKRRKLNVEGKISDLPEPILWHILSFLPIKDIAKTSILSKRWRSLWLSFPELDFTSLSPSSKDLKFSSGKSKASHCIVSRKTIDVINHVLSLRDKQLDYLFLRDRACNISHIRVIRFRVCSSFSSLIHLIRRCMRYYVNELEMEVATDGYFNFPRCVLASDSLRVFKLKSCKPGFRLPPESVMRNGFRYLEILSLSFFILHDQPYLSNLFTKSCFPLLKKLSLQTCIGLKHLKVTCQGLEEFTLEKCLDLQSLEIKGWRLEKVRVAACFHTHADRSSVIIDAPNLRVLHWEGNSITYCSSIQKFTSLHEAFVDFVLTIEDINSAKLMGAWKLLSGLSNAHSLTLQSPCVEILSFKKYIPAALLHPAYRLKSLELFTSFNKNNIIGLSCLFRSCPRLRTVIIRVVSRKKRARKVLNNDLWDMSSTQEEQFWECQAHSFKPFLHHLKEVIICGFQELQGEFILAKFLLKHGKALQDMILCRSSCINQDPLQDQKIRSEIMELSPASSDAKVTFI